MELLKGLTIGRDDEAKVSPLDKVFIFLASHVY